MDTPGIARLLLSVIFLCFICQTRCAPDQTPRENVEQLGTMTTKGPVFNKSSVPLHAVLSIDGGGLRGIIAVEILLVVENAIKKVLRDHSEKYHMPKTGEVQIYLADYFTAMAGVSSGAWIASYLATKGGGGASSFVFDQKYIIERYGTIRPGSVDGLKVLFIEYGRRIYNPINPEIFRPQRLFKLVPPIPGVTCSRHPSRGLREAMNDFLGESTFDDTECILFVPAYDLMTASSVMFVSGNFETAPTEMSYTFIMRTSGEIRDPNQRPWQPLVQHITKKKYKLSTLVHAASAAPILHDAVRFHPVNDESLNFYCTDNSLLANNPTLQTIILLSSKYGGMTQLSVMSIGSGIVGGSLAYQKDSGAYQWLLRTTDLFDIITDGSSELIQAQIDMFYYYVLRQAFDIGRGQYLRIQTSADVDRAEGAALSSQDNYDFIEELQEIGKETAARFRENIDQFVAGYVFCIEKFQFESEILKDPRVYSRARAEEEEEQTFPHLSPLFVEG